MNSSATIPVASSAIVQEERILVAITKQEQEMFLPGIEWEKITAHPCSHADLSKMNAACWEALLRDYRPTVLVSAWNTPALPASWVAAPELSLRYVCHLTGSVRNIVPRAFLERGGLLTNWGGLAGETVAEHALLLALSSLRRQPSWLPVIMSRNTSPGANSVARLRTRTLRGRRVGIHGFGHVARSLVRLLQPFGVEIAAFSQGVPPALMRAAGITPCDSLRDLAARSEVFFECEALNPRTVGSVNAPVLAALAKGTVFVNVGRGAVVDESALLAAARTGRIHVALDVLTRDPIGPDSPFLTVTDAIVSPHVAGPTFDQLPECGRLALDNLSRYLRGEPPETPVTADVYDRST